MWRPVIRVIASQGLKARSFRVMQTCRSLSGLVGSPAIGGGGNPDPAAAPKIPLRARDTLDLIDQLLWVLGPSEAREAGFVFFDLDETLITRDTCLIDGLRSTRALMARLEEKLGPSSEILRIIHLEMERDYYNADTKLVDPLLARVIRALKIQGHSVFGLTSNSLDYVHVPTILETLAKYKIRFSVPDVRGELPRSGALVMDHPVSRGVLFVDNQQAVKRDKGKVIAEFVGLLLHNASHAAKNIVGGIPSGSSEQQRRRKCILVDNTVTKCEQAAESFAQQPNATESLELYTVHFTEAENLVDSPDALMQLRRILSRLKARGLISIDLVAEDILAAPKTDAQAGGKISSSSALRPKEQPVLTAQHIARGRSERESPMVGA